MNRSLEGAVVEFSWSTRSELSGCGETCHRDPQVGMAGRGEARMEMGTTTSDSQHCDLQVLWKARACVYSRLSTGKQVTAVPPG